jgi:hypothetical protein
VVSVVAGCSVEGVLDGAVVVDSGEVAKVSSGGGAEEVESLPEFDVTTMAPPTDPNPRIKITIAIAYISSLVARPPKKLDRSRFDSPLLVICLLPLESALGSVLTHTQ